MYSLLQSLWSPRGSEGAFGLENGGKDGRGCQDNVQQLERQS